MQIVQMAAAADFHNRLWSQLENSFVDDLIIWMKGTDITTKLQLSITERVISIF